MKCKAFLYLCFNGNQIVSAFHALFLILRTEKTLETVKADLCSQDEHANILITKMLQNNTASYRPNMF